MRFYDALKLAIEDQKKIRLRRWNSGEFIYWADARELFIVGANSATYSLEQKEFLEEWDVYEPLVDFSDLKPGNQFKLPGAANVIIFQKIKMHSGGDDNYIWFDSYDECHSDFMKDEMKVVEL